MHDDQKNVLSSTTLFVGDLSVTCTEPMLMQLFSQCGTTTEVRIIRTRRNASLGYAFVTMSTAEDATTAIKQLNGHMLNGRSLRIGFANEVDNRKQSAPQTAGLYNNGDLGSKDVNDVESLRSGFCSSQNHSSHGDYVPNIVHGPQNSSMPVVQPIHPLMTSENSSLLNAQLNSQQTSHDHANSVYFKFYMSQSRSTQEPATDEGIIRDLFCTKCGPNSVSDVSIRRIAEEDNVLKGYGFIHFANISSCVLALQNWSAFTHNGVTYSLEMSKNLQKQLLKMNMMSDLAPEKLQNQTHPHLQPQPQQQPQPQALPQTQLRPEQSARARYASNNRATALATNRSQIRPQVQTRSHQEYPPYNVLSGIGAPAYSQQSTPHGSHAAYSHRANNLQQQTAGWHTEPRLSPSYLENGQLTSHEPLSSFGELDMASLNSAASSGSSGSRQSFGHSVLSPSEYNNDLRYGGSVGSIPSGIADHGRGVIHGYGQHGHGHGHGHGHYSQQSVTSSDRGGLGGLMQNTESRLDGNQQSYHHPYHQNFQTTHSSNPPLPPSSRGGPLGLISPLTSLGNSRSTSISSMSHATDGYSGGEGERFHRTVSDVSLSQLYMHQTPGASNVRSYDANGLFSMHQAQMNQRATPGGFCDPDAMYRYNGSNGTHMHDDANQPDMSRIRAQYRTI